MVLKLKSWVLLKKKTMKRLVMMSMMIMMRSLREERTATSTLVSSKSSDRVDHVAQVLIYGGHCVGDSGEATCERTDREYNVRLRMGCCLLSSLRAQLVRFLARKRVLSDTDQRSMLQS